MNEDAMNNSENGGNELVIFESTNISVKGNQFRLLLTNKRILLDHGNDVHIHEIPLQDIQNTKAETSPAGEPTILLFIRSASSDSKRMILCFSQNDTRERAKERDQWISEINNLITFKTGEPPKNTFRIIDNPTLPADSLFCSRCGNKSPSGSTFCSRCGSKIIPSEQEGNEYYPENNRMKVSTEKNQVSSGNLPDDQPQGKNPVRRLEPVQKALDPEGLTSSIPATPGVTFTSICCGGVIVLIIIAAISASVTKGISISSNDSVSDIVLIPTEETPITTDVKSLALTMEDLPDGWMELDKISSPTAIRKNFLYSIGSSGVVVNYNITKFSSINEAKKEVTRIRKGLNDENLIDMSLGNESFGYSGVSTTFFIFRERNVVTAIQSTCYPPLKLSTLQDMGYLGWKKMMN